MNVPDAVRQTDPGAGQPPEEEADARPEGPAPEPEAEPELEEELAGEEAESNGGLFGKVSEWAVRTPEGSYRETDARDFWDPDGGGKHRLAHHLTDLVGAGDIPNWLGVCIGAAEIYVDLAGDGSGFGGGGDNDNGGDGYPEIQTSGGGAA